MASLARRASSALACISFFGLIALAEIALAEGNVTREYDLKAVFLLNFGQFVDWPPADLADDDLPFVIGVLGKDPFGTTLDALVQSEMVRNRRITIRRYGSVDEIERCHILFISQSERERMGRILDALRGRSILTVGDVPEFSNRSGMILFTVVDNRLRLKINVAETEAAHLTISSKLLRQADLVRSGTGR